MNHKAKLKQLERLRSRMNPINPMKNWTDSELDQVIQYLENGEDISSRLRSKIIAFENSLFFANQEKHMRNMSEKQLDSLLDFYNVSD